MGTAMNDIPISMRAQRSLIAAVSALLLAACGGSPDKTVAPPSCSVARVPAAVPTIAAAVVPNASPYDAIFEAAGAEFGVPAGLVRAIGYVETRWQMVEGEEEFVGMPVAHGVMALRGERLREGARLAVVGNASARRDAAANIRAAAALLRTYGDSTGAHDGDITSWSSAVARFSGIALLEGQQAYVADVFAVLDGRRSEPAQAEAAVVASGSCTTPPPSPPPAPSVDQAGAVWRASPNFNSRMAGDGGRIHIVIVHSCEGSYSGCWSWLAQQASGVSAHYVVREDGAEITQLVRESSRAWHIGAIYDSTLNANHDGLLHGVQSNHFTIGIEHAGFAAQTSWPVAQIDASARLVCDLSKRWQVPRDRLHIVSHGQLQPYNRTDPGSDWPWTDYLARINQYCAA